MQRKFQESKFIMVLSFYLLQQSQDLLQLFQYSQQMVRILIPFLSMLPLSLEILLFLFCSRVSHAQIPQFHIVLSTLQLNIGKNIELDDKAAIRKIILFLDHQQQLDTQQGFQVYLHYLFFLYSCISFLDILQMTSRMNKNLIQMIFHLKYILFCYSLQYFSEDLEENVINYFNIFFLNYKLLLLIINKRNMYQTDHPNLDYNQKVEPHQKLQIHNYHDKYQLGLVTSKKLSSEGLVVRYDQQNQLAAIGCKNGDRIIYNVAEHKIEQKYNCANQNPVTTLKWRPMVNSTSKTLVTADSQGSLEYWHLPSLKKLFSMRQQNNTINTIDFNRSGSVFATAGSDCNIRIYDQQTKSLSITLNRASEKHPGHDNRIFAVKFIDQTTLISGGWDSNLHIWDLKQGKSVRCIYGPNISGQSLDFQDGKILAGCYSANNQIQVWDFNKGTKVQCIDWTNNIDIAAYVYAASYSKYDIGMFGVGSTGADSSVRIYKDISNKGEHVLLSELKNVNQGCFSLDFSHKKSQIIFTTAHHGFYVYDIKRK